MNNKEFLYNKPLELSLPSKEANAFRKIITALNTQFVLEIKEEKGVFSSNLQYYDFKVTCPTTSFANAYMRIGIEYGKKVLPIWTARHKKIKNV